MTKALVLGGGGPVGIGWQAGLLVGLERGGADLSDADDVVGTSAGSVVGFTLASGRDLAEATTLIGVATEIAARGGASDPAVATKALDFLISSLADAATNPSRAEAVRARVGEVAVAATTMSEDAYLGMFGSLADEIWPPRFRCTAVDTADGSFKLWDSKAGVDVRHAVASSCAVPGIFPPVTIQGRRWMDGGVRDMVNADVAAGHDVIVAVSCTVLDVPEGLDLPGLDAMLASTRGKLDALRRGGAKVQTVLPGPEMLEISEWGLNLMDFGRAAAAYDAGIRQGEELAGDLSGLWAG